tara:strand:- start:1139 stop:2389 length:1251 start_codon:yes stop_codon:yes gene_type:complete
MILIYRLLINLIFIFSPLIILIRLLKKKEHPIRFKEKFTYFSKKRKKGNLVWFHGASVGELMSVIPLIEKLEKNGNINQILVTTSTLSSSKIFNKFKFTKTIHQFFPVDTNYLTKKFLNYWRPNLAIFIDSEIWPNMLSNLKKKSVCHILLNARITRKSFKRWRALGTFSENLFKSFDYTYPQNNETKNYLRYFKVTKIKQIGNLKFSESIFNTNESINLNLKKFFKKKKIWCAASTHDGEELIAGKVHLNLQKKFSNLITIIIPRNIQRTERIVNIFSQLNLNIHLHSSNKKILNNTQVYIVDSYGETKAFFKVCKIVFLGKSLITPGGQNPLEPARYNCNIIHGPKVSNFQEVYRLLGQNKISFKVNNQNQLSKKINELLKKDIRSNHLGGKINIMGDRILKRTLIELNSFIQR